MCGPERLVKRKAEELDIEGWWEWGECKGRVKPIITVLKKGLEQK